MLPILRVALRQYSREPAFALTVVCTLAVTIGATAAVFAVVNAVIVRPLPFPSSDELMWIASVRSDNPSAPFTLPEFMDYRRDTRTLSGLVAYANWSASMAGDGITERLTGSRMSANAFDVLGVTAAAGRLLTERDDRPDAPKAVVLSYRLWQRKYGGAADAIGRTVRINSEPFVIVGVLPAQFPFPLPDLDVVTALVPARDPLRYVRNSVNFLRFFGRLNPGTERDRAQAELTALCGALKQRFPVEYARKESVRLVPLHEALVGDFRPSMVLLLAAVMVVLGAALANLVSLALVRTNGRRSELSIRIAVGASRWRLARQLALETLMLTIAGGGLGLVLAGWAIVAVMPWAPPSLPRLAEVGIDRPVTLFVAAITVAATALLAAAPLVASARLRAGDVLASQSRGAIGDRWNHKVRNVMVVGEISAALVLVLTTIVLARDLRHLHDLHLGFAPDGVFQARVSIPPAYRSPDDLARFYERLSDRLAGSPGVKQFGMISVGPLSGLIATVPFTVADQSPGDRDRPSANLRAISPGYLATVGTRVLQGRAFSEHDRPDTPSVALVSAALADRFLPGAAVGWRLMIDDNNVGPRPVEIVGVVENVRHVALDLPPAFDVYVPLRQTHPDGVLFLRNNQFWMVRTGLPTRADLDGAAGPPDLDPGAFRATFVAHLRAVDPDAAISGAGTMREHLDAWLGPRRFTLGLFCAFAVSVVLLAMTGLYGVVSYVVSQRGPEIGLRMAIGASRRDVQWMILRQAAVLGAAGTAVGLGVAGIGRQFITARVPSMPNQTAISPTSMAATAALLFVVVVFAAWLPARRATRIEDSLKSLISSP
jgi:predicted permease